MDTQENISVTKTALSKAIELEANTPEYKGKSLRLYLDGKGCDGFFYGVTFDNQTKDDTIFAQDGIDIVVDPDTYYFVKGSEIDWVDDDRGQGFLVENPNHKSFRGKFYKRKSFLPGFNEYKTDQ